MEKFINKSLFKQQKKRNTSQRTQDRTELFREILSAEEINLTELEDLCFHGIPEDRAIKALCWKILLGYLPPKPGEWKDHLKQQRNLYEFYINLLFQNPDTYDNGQGPNDSHKAHHAHDDMDEDDDEFVPSTDIIRSQSYHPSATQQRPYSARPGAYFQDDHDNTETKPKPIQKKLSIFDDSDDERQPKAGLFDSDADDDDTQHASNNNNNNDAKKQKNEDTAADPDHKEEDETEPEKATTDNQPDTNSEQTEPAPTKKKKGASKENNIVDTEQEDKNQDDQQTASQPPSDTSPSPQYHRTTNSISSNNGAIANGTSTTTKGTRDRGHSNQTSGGEEVMFFTPSTSKKSSSSFKENLDNPLLKDLPEDEVFVDKKDTAPSPPLPPCTEDKPADDAEDDINNYSRHGQYSQSSNILIVHNEGQETKKRISFEDGIKTPKMFNDDMSPKSAETDTTPRRRGKHHKSRTESRILINGQDINLMDKKGKEKVLQFNEVRTPDPLSKHPNNPWKTYFDDWEIWNRIKKDIHRTHQTYAFFRSNHMIADDSASKRYRFPFDIAQSPPPMTPSVSMSGAGNVMWNPKIPAHGHTPLFSVGHRRTGTESVGAPILHIPTDGLRGRKGSDSSESTESSAEFLSGTYHQEDGSDHEQGHVVVVAPNTADGLETKKEEEEDETEAEHVQTVQDEPEETEVVAEPHKTGQEQEQEKETKHVQFVDDVQKEASQTSQPDQEHPHEDSPSQPQPEDHEEEKDEKASSTQLEKQQSNETNDTAQSSPQMRKKSSLLKMDEEVLELDIESADEFEDADTNNGGPARPRLIGINTNPELPPPAAKNIKFRTSVSQSQSRNTSLIDPNKKARIERYVMDSRNEGIHSQIMIRILCVYARLNKGIEYVQGMNELLAPIYYIFNMDPSEDRKYAEADSFFCFMNLMSYLGDRFIAESDNSQLGIIAVVNEFDELLEVCDYELWAHLKQQDLDSKFYALRWLMLLMAMEFQLPEVLRLWDSFLSDHNRFEFVTYFAISMLEKVRPQLMSGNFATNLQLLQKYPSFDLYELLLPAMQYRDKYPMETVKTKRKKRKKKKSRTMSQNGRDNSLKNKHNHKKQKNSLASPANTMKPKSRSPRDLFRSGTSSARDLLGNVLRPQSTRMANSKSPPRSRPNPAYNIFRSKSPQPTTKGQKPPPGLDKQRSLSFAQWKKKFAATK